MRMGMRRFTRLTNGFSKKIENHMHAVALHYMYYNFVRTCIITLSAYTTAYDARRQWKQASRRSCGLLTLLRY